MSVGSEACNWIGGVVLDYVCPSGIEGSTKYFGCYTIIVRQDVLSY